ncbi:DUF6398 domain-containing protein [Jeotgalibacillus malaysiensis]|uniref:DUF6398 domain-containing protein n=1 Tax=Jeotgalibacillus malaysiensis TaxID=1508404 RepID=UPI003850F29B
MDRMEERKAELLKLTKDFCDRHLNEEYEELTGHLIELMSKEEKVLFMKGQLNIWAAAVVHAVGFVNRLSSSKRDPYVPTEELFEYFGVKAATPMQKSRKLRERFNMNVLGSEFETKATRQNSSFNNIGINVLFNLNPDYKNDMEQGSERPISDSTNHDFSNEDWSILEDYEEEIGKVLGFNELKTGVKYPDQKIGDMFYVDKQNLLKFYHYLDERFSFPIEGYHSSQIGPQIYMFDDLTCTAFDQKIKVDPVYGIIMDCIHEDEPKKMPLAQLEVEEDHDAYHLLKLYHKWFFNYK